MLEKTLGGLTLYYKLGHALRMRGVAATTMAEHRRLFYERAWQDAAAKTGCNIATLGDSIFEVSRGQRRIRVCLNFSPLDDSVTLRLAGRKAVVYRMLAEAGIPVPKHVTIKDLGPELDGARRFARAVRGPVVVKPAYGTGAGAGVTTNNTSVSQLLRAIAWARAFCPEAIIEEQVSGENYRLLYLDGVLIDCIVRRPPTVTGNGKSSIRELIRRENAKRVQVGISVAQALLPIDLDARNTLAARGKSLSTIPAAGEIVAVKEVINGNRAEDNESATSVLCDSNVEMGRQIVARLGVRLAGVDIITPDPSVGLRESGGAVVDVNTTPGFHYHYWKKDGEFAAAIAVLNAALGEGRDAARAASA